MLFATRQSTRGISGMGSKCAEAWLHFHTLSFCFPWLPRVQRSLSHESLDLQGAWRSQCLARGTWKPQLGERCIYNSSCLYAPAQNSLAAERLPPLNLGFSTHRVETVKCCVSEQDWEHWMEWYWVVILWYCPWYPSQECRIRLPFIQTAPERPMLTRWAPCRVTPGPEETSLKHFNRASLSQLLGHTQRPIQGGCSSESQQMLWGAWEGVEKPHSAWHQPSGPHPGQVGLEGLGL